MARRTEQRRAAIWALYQSDLLERPLDETFPRDVHNFSRVLATEVKQHQPELDALITRYASGWTLGRIAPLERSILRVGLLELIRTQASVGLTEIGCHPARVTGDFASSYLRERAAELETLTAPGLSRQIEALGVELVSFARAQPSATPGL